VSTEVWERLEDWARDPSTVAISTDIDGTLAPIVPTPDEAEVPEELKELLRRLSRQYRVVAGVSGRAAEDALRLLSLEKVVYYGNHGFEVLHGGKVEIVPEAAPYKEKIQELEKRVREELEPSGAFIEGKGITASIHYRDAPSEVGQE
jgi:trehalose-phosphatase